MHCEDYTAIYMQIVWGYRKDPKGLVCFYHMRHLHKRAQRFNGLCFKENAFNPAPMLKATFFTFSAWPFKADGCFFTGCRMEI